VQERSREEGAGEKERRRERERERGYLVQRPRLDSRSV